ncbi:MAG TPA: hypothetical protein PK050_14165 [Hyphomonadaceae bacterium]|nr:hypothetical protein [Hyphomonadaceae bacterium]
MVFGVFLAFQITAWNDARIDREQERDLLIRLHEDIQESIAGQTRDINFLDAQLADQAVILASLDACAVTPDNSEAFQRGINTLSYINPPRLYRRTVDELAAAGKIDLLQNEALKAELAGIVALVEWRGGGFDQVARLTEHYRFNVEDRVRYDLQRIYPDPFIGDFIGVDYDIAALCKQPIVASAISATSLSTRDRRNAYQPILDGYHAFLPMIEDELRTRWSVNTAKAPAP